MANFLKDDDGIYHLTVGTEVSAKYRGAFCEAQIKNVKKNLIFRVVNRKNGKTTNLSEENVRGSLKVGSVVESRFPDQQGWVSATIQSIKDRSSYTVVFDDGDERTLTRASLCLKGDRHYAKSETLDNLPLTDPENFGTPVLAKKFTRPRRRTIPDDNKRKDDDYTAQKVSDSSKQDDKSFDEDELSEDDLEKREKWLADPLMGKVVIVEPNDKRKHWFPALVVNPLCCDGYENISLSHLVVRSFKEGKFIRVSRSIVRKLNNSTAPSRIDAGWKEILQSAKNWDQDKIVPDSWRMCIKDLLSDKEVDDTGRKRNKDGNTKSEGKVSSSKMKLNHDFLEILYKFMSDRGTPLTKTPVLGYKDLDLYHLYTLVQRKNGSHSITSIRDWKQIYSDLGIPKPNPAAGYNVKTAYNKYLYNYEEYCSSWEATSAQMSLSEDNSKTFESFDAHQPSKRTEENEASNNFCPSKSREKKKAKPRSEGRTSPVDPFIDDIPQLRPSGRRRVSESISASVINKKAKLNDTGTGLNRDSEMKLDFEVDDEDSRKSKTPDVSYSHQPQYVQGDKLQVKYGQGKTMKLYDAKVLQVKLPENPGEQTQYLVHYAGWNSRHDELIKINRIVGLMQEKTSSSSSSLPSVTKSSQSSIKGSRNLSNLSQSSTNCAQHKNASSCDNGDKSKTAVKDSLVAEIPDKKPKVSETKTKISNPPSPVLDGSKTIDCSDTPDKITSISKCLSPVSKDLQYLLEEDTVPTNVAVPGEFPNLNSDNPPFVQDSKSEEENVSKSANLSPSQIDISPTKLEEIEEQSITSKPEEECDVDEDETEKIDVAASELQMNNLQQKNLTMPQPSMQMTRRSSGRRSKSPAYLSHSTLYGMIKKTRYSSSKNSPTNNSPDVSEVPPMEDTLPTKNEILSEDIEYQRSSSPSLSVSSLTSLENADMDATKRSPVLSSRSTKSLDLDVKSSDEHLESCNIKEDEDTATTERESPVDLLNYDKMEDEDEEKAKSETVDMPEWRQTDTNLTSVFDEDTIEESHNEDNENLGVGHKEEENSLLDENVEGNWEQGAVAAGNIDITQSNANESQHSRTMRLSPMCSKALLENTPPATPEYSPAYNVNSFEDTAEKNWTLDSDSEAGNDVKNRMIQNEQSQDLDEDIFEKDETQTTGLEMCGSHIKYRRHSHEEANELDSKMEECVQKSDVDSESEDADDESNAAHNHKQYTSACRSRSKRRGRPFPEPPTAPPPIHCEELANLPQDNRIALLQSRMAEMRKVYQQLKQEVANIDRKRKRARRKEREEMELTKANNESV